MGTNPTWNYIAYFPNTTTLSVSNLDIKAFINDAVGKGSISTSWYLISVETGFEIWQGGTNLSISSFSATVNNSLGTAPLNVLGPPDMSVLSGTVTFKGLLTGTALSAYQMYWNVDGGQFNLMSDNTTNGDKEALVDLTGWTWRDAGNYYGPFAVTLTAEDLSGNIVQQKTVTIYRSKP
jgi:glycosyl hydrolase family 12